MDKQCRQISVYLDDTTHAALAAVARKQGRSLSSHVKSLIEREIDGAHSREDKILDNQVRLLIGVDALIKHHGNEKLFSIVRDTRKAKLGGSSDEA